MNYILEIIISVILVLGFILSGYFWGVYASKPPTEDPEERHQNYQGSRLSSVMTIITFVLLLGFLLLPNGTTRLSRLREAARRTSFSSI